jgi:hypothetical protein
MKPKELRLGNYFCVSHRFMELKKLTNFSRITQITSLSNDFKSWEPSYGFYHEGIFPIPISEEWFEKFGIKYYEFLDSWSTSDGKMTLIKNDNGFYKLENYPCQDLKYVHQLQNLYFALTGKEL